MSLRLTIGVGLMWVGAAATAIFGRDGDDNLLAGPHKLLFTSNRAGVDGLALYSMNPDGTGIARIGASKEIELDAVYSPDGSRIAFTVFRRPTAAQTPPTASVWIMDAAGGNRRRVTPEDELCWMPSWSPKGDRLVYSKTVDIRRANEFELRSIATDGTAVKELGPGLAPQWSPDGKRILFTEFSAERIPAVLIMDADGSNRRRLVDDEASLASWSPNGRQVAYMGGPKNSPDIFTCAADGSAVRQITATEDAIEFAPTWSADGKRLYFTRAVTGAAFSDRNLRPFSVGSDGKDERPLFKPEPNERALFGPGAGLVIAQGMRLHRPAATAKTDAVPIKTDETPRKTGDTPLPEPPSAKTIKK